MNATVLLLLLFVLAIPGCTIATTVDFDLFNDTCKKRPAWCKGTPLELPQGCYGRWPCESKTPCLGSPIYDSIKAELQVGMANRSLEEVIVASR